MKNSLEETETERERDVKHVSTSPKDRNQNESIEASDRFDSMEGTYSTRAFHAFQKERERIACVSQTPGHASTRLAQDFSPRKVEGPEAREVSCEFRAAARYAHCLESQLLSGPAT